MLLASGSAMAVDICEFNGKLIRSQSDYAGQSGNLVCKDSITNILISSNEIKNGVRNGLAKEYKGGILTREYSLNANGAYHGVFKEYIIQSEALILQKEIQYVNGAPNGVSKSYSVSGELKRIGYSVEGAKELAFAEFTENGKLAELACTDVPVFGSVIDDATWCGHKGSPVSVTFYEEDDFPKSKVVFEKGSRRQVTKLQENGTPISEETVTAKGGVDRFFLKNGKKKREIEWVYQGVKGNNTQRVNILDRQYSDEGVLISEQKWKPVERGTLPVSVATWYKSGLPKMKSDFVQRGAPPELVRREVIFHENGSIAGEGMWGTNGTQDTTPRNTKKRFNEAGSLIVEHTYNERGELIRERDYRDDGSVIRDNEITSDGRKISMINRKKESFNGLMQRK